MNIHKLSPPRVNAVQGKGAPRAATTAEPTDWVACERDYSENKFSLRELAQTHRTSTASIKRRVAKFGWRKDLRDAIAVATRQALLDREVAERSSRRSFAQRVVTLAVTAGEERDAELVFAAAEQGATIIQRHREDVGRQRHLVNRLVENAALVICSPELLIEAFEAVVRDGDNDLTKFDRQVLRSAFERRAGHLDAGQRHG